jgi:hypothetical protein
VRARARAQLHPHPVGAQVILASADSSLKAGMLLTLKARIDRIVHYSSVYDAAAAMRRHRREVRSRRKSTYAKIMAAVTLRATGGRGRFRDCVGACQGRPRHLHHAGRPRREPSQQGKPTKKAHVMPAGRKVAPRVSITETKHTASELEARAVGGPADAAQVPLHSKQGKYIVKVTFDARQISKTKAQTEVMLLLIPECEEGQFYCQSALRIRTVLVCTGKDGKEQLQANLGKVMEEIEDVRARGLRYCVREDTFVGQDPDAPLESGDRNVAVEFFMPADMCSHFRLRYLWSRRGEGGPTKCFCTHCKCRLDQRHRKGIDRPQAVWAACSNLNGILSICLCGEWPASTSHGPQRGACGGAGCTVRPAALRQAGQRHLTRLTRNVDYQP